MSKLIAVAVLALSTATACQSQQVTCETVPAEHLQQHLDLPPKALNYEHGVWKLGDLNIGVALNGEEDSDVLLTNTCK